MQYNLQNHLNEFPHSAVQIGSDGRLYGIFIIGNNYKRTSDFHGQYPPRYLERVRSLFPDASPVLHLFSGSLESVPGEWTVDANIELTPDICCDAIGIGDHFDPDFFEIAFVDPPYTPKDALKYGFEKMPNIPKVLDALHGVMKPEGIVVWLSTMPPMWKKTQWRLAGVVGLWSGTNRVFRAVTFLEKL